MPLRKIQVVGVFVSGVALALAVVPAAMCQPLFTQDNESASADTAKEDTSYKKKSLSRLRKEFDNAEKDFYALFNTVNMDDEFDVVCKYESSLGSRRKVHACKAEFLWDHEEDLARQYSSRIGNEGGSTGASNSQLDKKQEILRGKISSAISENPDLQASFAILVRAKKDLDAKLQDR